MFCHLTCTCTASVTTTIKAICCSDVTLQLTCASSKAALQLRYASIDGKRYVTAVSNDFEQCTHQVLLLFYLGVDGQPQFLALPAPANRNLSTCCPKQSCHPQEQSSTSLDILTHQYQQIADIFNCAGAASQTVLVPLLSCKSIVMCNTVPTSHVLHAMTVFCTAVFYTFMTY